MILHSDTDAAYLVLPKSRNHITGNFYLSNHPPPTDTPKQKLNYLILPVFQTLKTVVASAAEAETGGMLLNGQTMFPIRNAPIAMDNDLMKHLQPMAQDSNTPRQNQTYQPLEPVGTQRVQYITVKILYYS